MAKNPQFQPRQHAGSFMASLLELCGYLQAGRVIVLSKDDITVDGKPWECCEGMDVGSSESERANHTPSFRVGINTTEISFGGKPIHLKTTIGLRYIECLIRHPREEVHASKLVDLIRGCTVERDDAAAKEAILDGMLNIKTEHSEAKATPEARKAVQKRRNELEAELKSCKTMGLPTYDLEDEIKMINKYLRSSGFKRHPARFANRTKRDSDSVRKAIKVAIRKISTQLPVLAEHFGNYLHFGIYFSYRQLEKIHWRT
jgi:hypothetical protein